MKGVKIEIVKAAEDSDDGDVLIRLLDVFELPEAPEFRIDPLDDDARGLTISIMPVLICS